MWAIVDRKTQTVIKCVHNKKAGNIGHTYEEAVKMAGDNILVEMTLINSPAYLYGKYDGIKFHPPTKE
jgi:hypothetical protein